jgi:UDPglucose--hexose-1-phosphate uridylyltransferase
VRVSEPAPEVRIDQLTGLRTILAPARAERPIEWSFEPPRHRAPGGEGAEERPGSCPFCEGNEGRTPPETWADRPEGGSDGPGWRVRAVPNLYPVLAAAPGGAGHASEGPRDPLRASLRVQPDLFASAPAGGSHEVIVHSPQHHRSLAELDQAQLTTALAGWRTRMSALGEGAACLQLIVNEGPEAGASLEHSHAQLYALDFVPAAIARERERFRAHHESTMGGELLSDIAAEEVRRAERLVAIDEEAVLICPWASRSPFELRLIPRVAAASFEGSETGTGDAMLATALRALRRRFGAEPQLNLWVRTAPGGAEPFHWHLDIVPRLTIRAGFELATGVEINVYPPERAAAELREALG